MSQHPTSSVPHLTPVSTPFSLGTIITRVASVRPRHPIVSLFGKLFGPEASRPSKKIIVGCCRLCVTRFAHDMFSIAPLRACRAARVGRYIQCTTAISTATSFPSATLHYTRPTFLDTATRIPTSRTFANMASATSFYEFKPADSTSLTSSHLSHHRLPLNVLDSCALSLHTHTHANM
jgi:hypothetical protein